jgi:hypothetical protein
MPDREHSAAQAALPKSAPRLLAAIGAEIGDGSSTAVSCTTFMFGITLRGR